MANREREDNIYYARLAEQGERYEDMIRYMKEVSNVSIVDAIHDVSLHRFYCDNDSHDQMKRRVNLKND